MFRVGAEDIVLRKAGAHISFLCNLEQRCTVTEVEGGTRYHAIPGYVVCYISGALVRREPYFSLSPLFLCLSFDE